MWVATQDLPRSAAHPFYARLNQILDQHDFDRFVEGLCERFYADDGRPGSIPGPGTSKTLSFSRQECRGQCTRVALGPRVVNLGATLGPRNDFFRCSMKSARKTKREELGNACGPMRPWSLCILSSTTRK